MNFTTNAMKLGMAGLLVMASPLVLAADETGWYGGASLGRSAATIDEGRITTSLAHQGLGISAFNTRDRDTGYKLFGGYQFNPYFGVEGGLFDLGSFGYTATTEPAGSLAGDIRVRGLNLDLVGTLPLTERLSVLGRVGANRSRVNGAFAASGSVRMPYASAQASDRSTDYKVGLGLSYALTKAMLVRGEAERYRIQDAAGNKGHVDMLSVSLVYRFGG